MTNSENFWEVRFIDFIPLITALISPILIYWIYRKLDKKREKARLKAIFIRIKKILENLIPEKNIREERGFFEVHLPFLRTQGDYLIKIGIAIGHILDKNIRGKIIPKKTLSDLDFNIEIKSESQIPTLYIVNKYIVGGATIQIMGRQFKVNIQNVNMILKEMRQYSKKFYGLKFKKRDTTIDYKHPLVKFFVFIKNLLIRVILGLKSILRLFKDKLIEKISKKNRYFVYLLPLLNIIMTIYSKIRRRKLKSSN